MKVINKHPSYIRNTDRVKQINRAYTVVFQSINKIESDLKITNHCTKRNNQNI